MPNATVRANARTLPETNRRALLGAVLATSAVVVAASHVQAEVRIEPELQALIAAWNDACRRLEETHAAYCAADDRARARCPVPQALVARESDASRPFEPLRAGEAYRERDVTWLRSWTRISHLNLKCLPDLGFPTSEFYDRANEIIASWDNWETEQKAAKEREGVADACALWEQAVENYHAIGHRVARQQAKTMGDVIAKLLAAAPHLTEDDLEDPTSSAAVLASAALDGLALKAQGNEVRT
jgi:hypothetical protein